MTTIFMLLIIASIAASVVAAAAGHNATVHARNNGFVCNLERDGSHSCKTNPFFDDYVKALVRGASESIRPAGKKALTVQATESGNVCAAVMPYAPSFCSCQNNAGGGVVDCKYQVVIGGALIDTLYVEVGMEVCANPASIGVSITDGATGYTFSESLTSGDTGSLPTGIMIGVPGVGNVQLVLAYKISGNIDALTVDLGVDLSMVVFGFTETCSSYYPTECPVWFFQETINFGSYC